MNIKKLFSLDISNPFVRCFVPIGLAQGLIAYAVFQGHWGVSDPFDAFFTRINYDGYVLSWLISAGLAFFLGYQPGNGRRAAVVAILFGLAQLLLWILAMPTVTGGTHGFWVGPWYVCSLILTYASLPFLQSYLTNGDWRSNYPTLFQHAWNNGQIIASSYVLTALFFLVLLLAGGLLNILKISLVFDLLKKSWFTIPAYFTVKAIGYGIARENESIVLALRRLCLGFCSFLAPILAIFAIIFVAILPASGLEPVWHTRVATPIFLGFSATTIFFFNAIFQDGARPGYFDRLNGKLQQIALIILPIFGLLAGYSTWLRLQQYGLTPERYYALVLDAVVVLYGACYAFAAVQPQRATALIQRSNIVLAWLMIALAVTLHLPYINASAMSARDRFMLIAGDAIKPEQYDLWWLRNELGDPGQVAFARLKTITNHPRQKELEEAIKHVEAQKYRYETPAVVPDDTLKDVGAYLTLKPDGSAVPPDALVQALLRNDAPILQGCRRNQNALQKCSLIAVDLTHDGQVEYVLVGAWQAKLYQYNNHDQNWQVASLNMQPVVRSLPGQNKGWQEIVGQAKTITAQPAPFDSLLIDNRVLFNFMPQSFPPDKAEVPSPTPTPPP